MVKPNKDKVERTPEQKKAYNKEMAEKRKTNEFFVASATKRTQTVIKSIDRLSVMGRYNGTDEQKEKIINAVDKAVTRMKNSLMKVKQESEKFSL